MKQPIQLLLVGLICAAGCSSERAAYDAQFAPNLVHAMKYQIKEGFSMDEASKDTTWLIDRMFGTPNDPKLPDLLQEDDYADLVSLERIKKAAGPIAEGAGLYRKHCVSCHGINGNGRGENSAILDPYPRDYRLGIFKFKSTERGSKPLREDLARSIGKGIEGTAMKKIPELSDEDVQALVDYVIYLSIRGELERALIDDAMFNLDLESGDRIVNRQLGDRITAGERESIETEINAWEKENEAAQGDEAKQKALEEDPRATLAEDLEMYDESMEISEDLLADIADSWLDAEDEVVEVPQPPSDIPVANSYEEFVQLSKGEMADALTASIEQGRKIFTGKVASCSKCHGEKGHGDGQNKDYDDWTKDWTTRAGLKPEDTESLIPLMARGAMPPKNARPRNFSEGVFRGGQRSEDLYRRIHQGIDGSPMPASTFVPEQYTEEDIWHLINFVRSIKQPEPSVDGGERA